MDGKIKYYDTHLHSSFSHDSEADAGEEIKAGIASGLRGMCFTEHNDFDYREPDGNAAFRLEFDDYINSMTDLRQRYGDKIEIMIGLEQGLTLPAAERIENYDPGNRLDFIIGSTHVVDSLDPYYPEFWSSHDAASGIRRYYENIFECVNAIGNFDVYGHLDYIIRYLPKQNDLPGSSGSKNASQGCYSYSDIIRLTPMELVREILKKLIYNGKGIEINTGGWRKGEYPNPAPFILKEYRQLGGEMITIGSDAHEAENIGYSIKKAHALLQECGFKYACVFRKRKADFYNL